MAMHHIRAPHEDKPFNHVIHIIATVATFGMWSGVWFWRLAMHKIDRNREVLWDVQQQLQNIARSNEVRS